MKTKISTSCLVFGIAIAGIVIIIHKLSWFGANQVRVEKISAPPANLLGQPFDCIMPAHPLERGYISVWTNPHTGPLVLSGMLQLMSSASTNDLPDGVALVLKDFSPDDIKHAVDCVRRCDHQVRNGMIEPFITYVSRQKEMSSTVFDLLLRCVILWPVKTELFLGMKPVHINLDESPLPPAEWKFVPFARREFWRSLYSGSNEVFQTMAVESIELWGDIGDIQKFYDGGWENPIIKIQSEWLRMVKQLEKTRKRALLIKALEYEKTRGAGGGYSEHTRADNLRYLTQLLHGSQ